MEKTDLNDLRKFLLDVLKTNKVKVTFQKTDGSMRKMYCTLNESVIQSYEKKTDKTRKESLDVLSVWDVEANGWRSFRLDSVKKIQFSLFDDELEEDNEEVDCT